ncbi:MAG: hypothetical protein J1E01_06760 [Acetatifactor sp.]|nr:hypothetical protein [Acetatifactor sp.]
MQKTVYEDYKYSMQDVGRVYVGCKYSFEELLDDDELLFKFRMIVERYILPEADSQDTLETHLYYLEPGSFAVKLYNRIKARVKVSVIEEKKSLFGKVKKEYVSKQLTVDELVNMPPSEKERQGMVIHELSVSKLALTAV